MTWFSFCFCFWWPFVCKMNKYWWNCWNCSISVNLNSLYPFSHTWQKRFEKYVWLANLLGNDNQQVSYFSQLHTLWLTTAERVYYHECYTVDSRYLDFGYLEQPLISKKNSGPCYNTEIWNQVIKYCEKEEKLLLGSNFSPFPQYFQYIFLVKGVKLHSHL